ncbi:MAG: hypothetical protein R6T90_05920 [Dissulfuribacterales bacterium]
MNDLQIQLLIDLHRSNFRQGPGGEAETKQALMLAGLDTSIIDPCKTVLMPSSSGMAGAIRQGKLSNVKRLKLPFMKSTGTTTATAYILRKSSDDDVWESHQAWF